MASPAWEADKMLDAYIYDYLQKRKLARSAEAFMMEANVSPDPVAIDAPGGFLFEWWSVFWDIFIARTNEKHSDVAHSYIEAQQAKVKEQQQQALQQQQTAQLQAQQQQIQQQQQAQQGLASQQQATSQWQLLQNQLQMQQQRQAAQRRENAPNGATPPTITTENLMRHSPANLLATKLYQDNLKSPRLPEGMSLDEAILKRYAEANAGQILQPQQQAALLRSTSANTSGLPNSLSDLDTSIARQILAANGASNAAVIQQARTQLLSPALTQDEKSSMMGRQSSPPGADMVAALSKAGFSAGQLATQALGKNWPAANIEQIRQQQQQQAAHQQLQQAAQQQQAVAQQQQQQTQQQAQQAQQQQQQASHQPPQLQRQGSNVSAGQFQFQSPQQYQQFQMLSPLQQRELLMHAQAQQAAQAAASGANQQERLRQMMAGKGFGHEGSQNGSPGASSNSQGPTLPLQQQELLLKLQAQRSANQLQAQFHQQQQQVAAAAAALQKGGQNGPGSSPHLQQLLRQTSNHSLQVGANGVIPQPGGDHPATSTDSRKTGKGGGGRKRKQPGTNSNAVPTSSTGTGTTVGGSMAGASEPPTPTTHRNEALLASLQHSSDALRGAHVGYGEGRADAAATSDPSPEDGSIDHVETFLSAEAAEDLHLRDALFAAKEDEPHPKQVVTSGFSFAECGVLRASTGKVVSCHFSLDGKVLATAGHDKKAILWDVDTQKIRNRLEEHSLIITDVRFAATSNRLATSSFDKTVRVWDADSESSCSLRTFARHQQSVMSVDFHPANDDVVCSCDSDGEVRMWSVDKGTCTRVFKGASMQVRFQPRKGLLLAMASEDSVTMYDVESEQPRFTLQRHAEPVQAVCWDPTGDVMASVSEDSVRIWAFGTGGGEGECLHELISSGNKFHSCVFHPTYTSLLVIGCYESLELWNMMENKSMTVMAHEGLIASLAQSRATGMVASASHDKSVKLWK